MSAQYWPTFSIFCSELGQQKTVDKCFIIYHSDAGGGGGVRLSSFKTSDNLSTQVILNVWTRQNKMNWVSGHLCAHICSWGLWDEWDDTALQTQDLKFEPWRFEAEYDTSRSRRLPTILNLQGTRPMDATRKFALKFQSFDVELRYRDPQLQVIENYCDLCNLRHIAERVSGLI